MDLERMTETAPTVLTAFGLKILGALVAWLVGRYLIGLAVRMDFTARGPVLAVRGYAHTDHYWQVYFDINRAIVDTFGAAGYAVPEEHVHMRQTAATAAG